VPGLKIYSMDSKGIASFMNTGKSQVYMM
jgi:hypothetical protein